MFAQTSVKEEQEAGGGSFSAPQRERRRVHDTRPEPWPSSVAGGRYAARTGLTSQHKLLLTRLPCCAQDDEEDPDDYYAKNSETQKLLMRDQDDTLKMLGSAVD